MKTISKITLTEWERDVVNVMAKGRTRVETAAALGCSESRIQAVMKSVASKTNSRNVVDMMLTLERMGLLDPNASTDIPAPPVLPVAAGPVADAVHGALRTTKSLKDFRDLRVILDECLERGW